MTLNNRGVSLVEIILVLVIMGFVAVVAGMGMVKITEGFVFTRQASEAVQKNQMVISRLMKEFNAVSSISSGSSRSITYTRKRSGGTHTVSWDGTVGGEILLDGNILTDRVDSFKLEYRDSHAPSAAKESTADAGTSVVDVSMGLAGADGIVSTYEIRATLRPYM